MKSAQSEADETAQPVFSFPTPSPQIVPDHELLRCIGGGAYGEVWLARNVMGELRAVKIIHRSRFNDARPFEREFEGIRRFEPISRSHPSQLAILHVGKNDEAGCFYYVMELADRVGAVSSSGFEVSSLTEPAARQPETRNLKPETYFPRTLRHDLEQRGRLPIADCIQIGLSLTTALAHLHKNGLVHRDIKPSNVIFVNGVPKLGDIGLVTEAGDTQSIVGTEGYIPPEGPGTPQADIFSLGKVLYEISTGMDRRRFSELPDDLRSWKDRSEVVEFNEILLKACAKDPDRRYRSAEAVREDITLLQQGKSIRRKRLLRRAGLVATISLVAVLLAFTVLFGSRIAGDGADQYPKSSKPEVNNLVQQGHELIRLEKKSQIWNAIEKFKQAIQLDPEFAPAYNGLFHAYVHVQGDPEGARGIREMTKKLLALAPTSTEARGADAFVKWLDWHFQEALADAGAAAKLRAFSKEGEAYKHLEYGYFLQESGDSTNALRQYEIANRLLPNDPIIMDHLGQAYLMQDNFAEAEKHLRNSIVQQPDHWNGHYFLARTYEAWKHFDDAIEQLEICDRLHGMTEDQLKNRYDPLREAFRSRGAKGYWRKKLEEAQKESPPRLYYLATLHAHLEEKEQAYYLLEKACQQHDLNGPMYDPCWDHGDPRFGAIMKRIGLLR